MLGNNFRDHLVFALAGGGSILAWIGILRLLLSTQRSQEARSQLRALLGPVWGCRRQRSEVNRIIDEKAGTVKLRQFRAALGVLCVVNTLISMNVAFNVASQKPQVQTLLQDLLIALGQLYLSLLLLLPRLVTLRNMDFHYCSLVLSFSVAILPCACTAEGLLKTMLYANGGVALLDAAWRAGPARRLPVLAVANGSFACSVSCSILVHGPVIFTLPISIVLLQLVLVCAMCVGSLALEVGFRAIVYQGMQLEEVKELHGAACAVLRSYCDVVVELDAEGHITKSAGDLSSLLLRSQPQQSLEGVQIINFIVKEDREFFLERLEESKLRQIGIAESVQVTMRDGCNNNLRLELMWIHFKRLDQTQHFLLGIREFSDLAPQRGSSRPAALASPEVAGKEPRKEPCLEVSSESSSEALAATRSVCSSVPEGAALDIAELEAAMPMLTINAAEPGMPIIDVNPAFCAHVGRLPLHAPSERFIRNSAEFVRWVQLSMNSMNFDESPAQPEHSVTLQMPTGQSFRVRFRICTVAAQNSGDEDYVMDYAQLLLVRVARLPTHGHRPRRQECLQGSLRGTPRVTGSSESPRCMTL